MLLSQLIEPMNFNRRGSSNGFGALRNNMPQFITPATDGSGDPFAGLGNAGNMNARELPPAQSAQYSAPVSAAPAPTSTPTAQPMPAATPAPQPPYVPPIQLAAHDTGSMMPQTMTAGVATPGPIRANNAMLRDGNSGFRALNGRAGYNML